MTEIAELDKKVEQISNDESSEDLESDQEDIEEESESEECSEGEDIESTEPVKKKRGRKCKPKDETESSEKIQKKRGRKPKVKTDEIEDEKIPKKRGRKPKEKVYSVKELPKTFFEENKNDPLILHLPITSADKPINNPQPNNNDGLSYSSYSLNNNMNLNVSNILENKSNQIEPLGNSPYTYSAYYPLTDDINSNSNILQRTPQLNFMDFNLNNSGNSNMFLNNQEFIQEKDKEKEKDLISRDLISTEDDSKNNRIIKKNLKNIMYEFINANNDKVWPETTNIYCWWCCHPFTWMPCALPEYLKKDKFYVNGCFCSFNCAASYNFSKCDDDIWERYSLLNLMYKKLYNSKFIKINLAPPREILKIFGGYMSIDEFRENSHRNDKTFTVINPPLISIIPKIEENISNSYKASAKGNISLVNENILNKTQNSLKLKRNKPVTNPNNTLQSFMDLKII